MELPWQDGRLTFVWGASLLRLAEGFFMILSGLAVTTSPLWMAPVDEAPPALLVVAFGVFLTALGFRLAVRRLEIVIDRQRRQIVAWERLYGEGQPRVYAYADVRGLRICRAAVDHVRKCSIDVHSVYVTCRDGARYELRHFTSFNEALVFLHKLSGDAGLPMRV